MSSVPHQCFSHGHGSLAEQKRSRAGARAAKSTKSRPTCRADHDQAELEGGRDDDDRERDQADGVEDETEYVGPTSRRRWRDQPSRTPSPRIGRAASGRRRSDHVDAHRLLVASGTPHSALISPPSQHADEDLQERHGDRHADPARLKTSMSATSFGKADLAQRVLQERARSQPSTWKQVARLAMTGLRKGVRERCIRRLVWVRADLARAGC